MKNKNLLGLALVVLGMAAFNQQWGGPSPPTPGPASSIPQSKWEPGDLLANDDMPGIRWEIYTAELVFPANTFYYTGIVITGGSYHAPFQLYESQLSPLNGFRKVN